MDELDTELGDVEAICAECKYEEVNPKKIRTWKIAADFEGVDGTTIIKALCPRCSEIRNETLH